MIPFYLCSFKKWEEALGEAALKEEPEVSILDEHFWKDVEGTQEAVEELFHIFGIVRIHSEPYGTHPQDGSTQTVTKGCEIPMALEAAFTNAQTLNGGFIWFSIPE